MSALSDALNAANVHRWSSREIARRAGNRVSHTQLAKYLKPEHPTPTDQVLTAFAEVFPTLPVTKLRSLAGQPAGEEEPYVPPPEGAKLNGRQRKAIDELIRSVTNFDSGSLFEARLKAEADALGIAFPRYVSEFELDFFRAREARLEEVQPEIDRLMSAANEDLDAAVRLALREEVEPFVFKLLLEVQRVLRRRDVGVAVLPAAARKGTASLAERRRRQDEAGEAPDPEGPEGGA